MHNQQIHGSKRSLRSIEDFTEFEQRTALTLEDTVEFFNIVTELNLTQKEKEAMVAFMRQL
jgi:hypothetical protein